MSKFKVGDKVKRISGSSSGSKIGHEAVISRIFQYQTGSLPWLKFEDGTEGLLMCFELVKTQSKIANQETKQMNNDITKDDLLKAAGNVDISARHLVGGLDVNGFKVAPANIDSAHLIAKDLRLALDFYDSLVLDYANQQRKQNSS